MTESLFDEYELQAQWRSFNSVLEAIGCIKGRKILDLGCGSGFFARKLTSLGANVTAVDNNGGLIEQAQRMDPAVHWVCSDFTDLDALGDPPYYGVWSSFAIAYVAEPVSWINEIRKRVRPDGWLAIVEMADLLDHLPLSGADRSAIAEFCRDATHSGRYRFDAGHRLDAWIKEAGMQVSWAMDLPDEEFCAQGPVSGQVLQAWRRRLHRMPRLMSMTPHGFSARFLDCLSSDAHRSKTRVRAVVGEATLHQGAMGQS